MLKRRGSMRPLLLILHILAGTVGLLSGTFAIAVRKGSRLHRASGNIFTVAMITLASSALCLAIMKSQHGNIIGSIITFYMVSTAWLAGRGRGIGRLDLAALLVGTCGAAAIIMLGVWTIHHPDKNAPAAMCFFMAAVLLVAAAGDIRMLACGGISDRGRTTRHLWRMCFGLFIATGSFFLGQQQVFPAFLRGSIFLTILAVLPFPLMIYWLFRVRFGKAYRIQSQAHPTPIFP
ncbi:DUF2306 domain-containing protein [Acidicapsa acidisoli]|uniref:hypothetical protein n=1 Tax=Acidicapsa acidisoli TaxID=1615681 RepID=UPI0021E00AFB|nr:hypothetical protein [Acidicapsa acidisoli]